jgi:hypothetical protein
LHSLRSLKEFQRGLKEMFKRDCKRGLKEFFGVFAEPIERGLKEVSKMFRVSLHLF